MGQTSEAPVVGQTSEVPVEFELGFNGVWKLGHVCPVRVSLPDEIRATIEQIEVQTVDGDGVEVSYFKSVTAENNSDAWISVRVGRVNAPLRILLKDASGEVLARGGVEQIKPSLSSSQPLVLALGSEMGLEALKRESADGSDSSFSTALITRAEQLPISWRDYSSIDLLVISTANSDLLAELGEQRWAAIDGWIRRGGGAIASLGAATADVTMKVAATPEFATLLPGQVTGVGRVNNPALLETMVATDEPIQPFPITRLELTRGRAEMTFTDSLGNKLPWWIRYSHGHGSLQLVASDLGHPSFANWEDRKVLWQMLLTPYFDRNLLEGKEVESATDSSYLGYADLVGQLRATLDVFSSVRVVSFGQVVAILVAILLVVGPLDYVVSVKWLKRPSLSWYFAGGVLLATTAGLAWLYGELRPHEVRINSVQVFDVDAETGIVNGRLWSHVYSGTAQRLNIDAELNQKAQLFGSGDREPALLVDWQGLPGDGLGGLRSPLVMDRGMPPYSIEHTADGSAHIKSVGIAAAGTKCVNCAWTMNIALGTGSELKEIPGVDQLAGELRNPFEEDIHDPILFYHNWFYILNSRIPAGSSVSIARDTIPKDLSRRLNRKTVMDDELTVAKWDPADRTSVDRLLELMMFHKAASGQNYTSLTHRYQPQMDFSNLLETDQAILIGRFERAPISIQVSTDSTGDLAVKQDMDRAWVRVMIPVTTQ